MNNILRYIKGLRRGKEAYLIELEALRDIFLSEALEGYDAIEDNHLKRITYLQKQVENYCHKKNKMIAPVATKPTPKRTPQKPKNNIPWKKWSVAAIFLLCLALGGYYIIENHESLFRFRSAVLSGYQKRTDSVENEIADTLKVQRDTLKVRQDTLIIYMPAPPKKNPFVYKRTSEDSLTEDRPEIEISKLDAPQTQLQVPAAPESKSETENTENGD